MSTAHVEALAFGALALVWLAISVGAFVRASHGGPRSSWRYVAAFGFVLCAVIAIANLNGFVLSGSGGDTSSSSSSVG